MVIVAEEQVIQKRHGRSTNVRRRRVTDQLRHIYDGTRTRTRTRATRCWGRTRVAGRVTCEQRCRAALQGGDSVVGEPEDSVRIGFEENRASGDGDCVMLVRDDLVKEDGRKDGRGGTGRPRLVRPCRRELSSGK